MPKLSKLTAIKVKLETTKGTKVAADQALLVSNLDIKLTAPVEDRPTAGSYLGKTDPSTIGEMSGTCSFDVELRGNGTTGVEAGLAILFQAAGLKKTSEVYNLHSSFTDQKTISIDVWKDGLKFGLAGAMGNIEIMGDTGKKIICKCEFSGIWQTPVTEAMPAVAPSATLPMKLQGGTFTVATVAKAVSKFSLNLQNQVIPELDINATGGISTYLVADYDPIVSVDPEAEPIATIDYFGQQIAGTENTVVLAASDGTTNITIIMPAVSWRKVNNADRDGIFAHEVVGQCSHSSGNDAVVISAA